MRIFRFILIAMAVYAAAPAALVGQTVPDAVRQQLGGNVSDAELLKRLKASGMSRAQVRARLQQLGYNPSLADPYFDALEAGEDSVGTSVKLPGFQEALARIGLARDSAEIDEDTSSVGGRVGGRPRMSDDSAANQIFGRALFSRESNEFQPLNAGPVDAGYRVGPGDEIIVILTGDVEEAYQLEVSREGFIVVPTVGQIWVNGLTQNELEARLFSRLANAYSGLSRDAGATTRLQVSMGKLRTNQIYITGDVEWPGAYVIGAGGTAFNALYQAGGPSENGSFRHVEVRRGGELIRTIDLYDYLIRGDSRGDIRLQHGDLLFVPPVSAHVQVSGAVRRPMIYELKDGEGMRQLLEFAGGFASDAIVRRVQVDRILPAQERRPGVERVVIDVDVANLAATGNAMALQDGDKVHVFGVPDDVRRRVVVTGEVNHPGIFEWSPGATLSSVLSRADGLREPAYTDALHIYRLNPRDGTRELVAVPVRENGTVGVDVVLHDRDSIVVFSRAALRIPEFVRVDGLVKKPGQYPFAEGMTLRDLVLAAGGFERGYGLVAELARRVNSPDRSNTIAELVRIPLEDLSKVPRQGNGITLPGERGEPAWSDMAMTLELRDGDHISIRKSPGFEVPQTVVLTGEVLVPGFYILEQREQRLSAMIKRAGGVTEQAYPDGLQLIRGGIVVAIDARRVLAQPGAAGDPVLEAGDSIHIPKYAGTVEVTGAVQFAAHVLYRKGAGVGYYVEQAGGMLDNADKKAVIVSYPDGRRRVAKLGSLLLSGSPGVTPGTRIHVPAKPEKGTGVEWDRIITRTVAVLSAVGTLMLGLAQLR